MASDLTSADLTCAQAAEQLASYVEAVGEAAEAGAVNADPADVFTVACRMGADALANEQRLLDRIAELERERDQALAWVEAKRADELKGYPAVLRNARRVVAQNQMSRESAAILARALDAYETALARIAELEVSADGQ